MNLFVNFAPSILKCMKNLKFLLLLSLFFQQCVSDKAKDASAAANAQSTPGEAAATGSIQCYTGLLLCRDSIALLWETKDTILFRLTDKTGTLIKRHNETCAPMHCPGETTHAVICGVKTSLMSQGRMQNFEVLRIDTLCGKTPENLGLPFEFWCYGSDPEWDIEVCNQEGGIFVQHPSEKIAWLCPWLPPAETPNKWVYTIPAAGDGMNEAMTLVVKKESFTDTKTGRKYDYSAVFSTRGKQFKGGAVRGKAPTSGPF